MNSRTAGHCWGIHDQPQHDMRYMQRVGLYLFLTGASMSAETASGIHAGADLDEEPLHENFCSDRNMCTHSLSIAAPPYPV